jgi:hypothetical protein
MCAARSGGALVLARRLPSKLWVSSDGSANGPSCGLPVRPHGVIGGPQTRDFLNQVCPDPRGVPSTRPHAW